MPLFIQRLYDPEIPPPYTFEGVVIHSFELRSNMAALRQCCDQLLNVGSVEERGFEYQPLFPYVALEILFYPKMASALPPFSQWGYISQNEAYFRFPVVKYDLFGPFLVPVEVSNFFPYLFVDNSWSAFSGRNVIGFPKVIGEITQQDGQNGSYSASVSAPVYPTFSPQTQQSYREIVRVQTGASLGPSNTPTVSWPWLITAFDGLTGAAESLLLEVAEMIYPDLLSTVQLKQIRDAQDPTVACFQGLVHSDFEVGNVSPPEFFESPSVLLSAFDNLDIAGELGLPNNPIDPVMAYVTKCDMSFGNTTNLFIHTDA
jgi:Acetoacetate decarboxylase (ADC)